MQHKVLIVRMTNISITIRIQKRKCLGPTGGTFEKCQGQHRSISQPNIYENNSEIKR